MSKVKANINGVNVTVSTSQEFVQVERYNRYGMDEHGKIVDWEIFPLAVAANTLKWLANQCGGKNPEKQATGAYSQFNVLWQAWKSTHAEKVNDWTQTAALAALEVMDKNPAACGDVLIKAARAVVRKKVYNEQEIASLDEWVEKWTADPDSTPENLKYTIDEVNLTAQVNRRWTDKRVNDVVSRVCGKDKRKVTIIIRRANGISYREIARELNISEVYARKTAERIRNAAMEMFPDSMLADIATKRIDAEQTAEQAAAGARRQAVNADEQAAAADIAAAEKRIEKLQAQLASSENPSAILKKIGQEKTIISIIKRRRLAKATLV